MINTQLEGYDLINFTIFEKKFQMKTFRYLMFLLFVMLFANGAYSQQGGVTKKPSTEKKTTPNTQTVGFCKLLISVDKESCLSVDEKTYGIIRHGSVKAIWVDKGEHIIIVMSSDNKLLLLKQVIEITDKGTKVLDLKIPETQVEQNQDKKVSNDNNDFAVDYGIEMILVGGGTFTMGCTSEQGSDCEADEKPSHSVTLSNFHIGKYEVTQKQWKAVMGNNPSKFTGCDDCPVENVSWDDVQEFITKLNQQTGKDYRLPTEAEWEYAARGGNISKGYKFSGSNNIDYVAWYDGNSGSKTHTVGQKLPNELGIYDMSGNVWEWCSDWYKGYPNSTGVSDYTNQYRVFRGGSWYGNSRHCRSSRRSHSTPGIRGYDLGFRLVFSK